MKLPLFNEITLFFEIIRTILGVLTWIWTIFIFFIGYYFFIDDNDNETDDSNTIDEENENERRPQLFRSVIVPIIKVL